MWCTRCQSAWYHTPDRLRQDWPRHKEECVAPVSQHQVIISGPSSNQQFYIAGLSLSQLATLKCLAVLILKESPLKDQCGSDDLLRMIGLKKGKPLLKLFKSGGRCVRGKVFGEPLELLAEKQGVASHLSASGIPLWVPLFIDQLISLMRTADLSVQGIFRKNGNIKRLKQAIESIDRDPYFMGQLARDNPVQLAALLKKFLGMLPEPLMTSKLHRLFIAARNLPLEEDRKRYLHLLCFIMPKPYRDTMEVLFVFLKHVASFAYTSSEAGNLMDLPRLATVITPAIMRPQGRETMSDEIQVVTKLLENQDEIFLVPSDLIPALQVHDLVTSLGPLGEDFLKLMKKHRKGA